jgi:WD40 repeat protein
MADDGTDVGLEMRSEVSPQSAWPRHLPQVPAKPVSPHTPPRVPDHELLRCIGSGAYGEVWLSRNILGGYRAVKVVYRASFDSDRPYQREFDGIQRVEPISRAHAGHVPILQAGRNDAEGYFYYVMELADDAGTESQLPSSDPSATGAGEEVAARVAAYVPRTLKEDLKRRGHLDFDECLRLALALASGLDYLHQHGLVHRDIKPSNIIYVGGAAKFTDIGLVTVADATCSVVGTEGYLPPEGPGSAQADLFSLGKVLYEAVTGMDRRNYPELPPQWPPPGEAERLLEINAIVLKACKCDSLERYQSAAQLHADLLLLQSGKSVRRTHLLEQRLASFYRIAAVLTAVAAFATGAYLWASFQMRQAERNLERAELSEAGMREQLRESLLHQAHALRLSRMPGQRVGALDALGRAGAIRIGPDLLSEVIRCLELTDARVLRTWTSAGEGHSDHMLDLRLDRVAASDPNGTITIQSMSGNTQIAQLPGPGLPCLLALFSPDGRYLAAKHHPLDREPLNRTILWELTSSPKSAELPSTVRARSIAFSPDSRQVAAGTRVGEIAVYDLPSLAPVLSYPIEMTPYALSYSPDGSRLAIAGLDGSVEVRATADGRLLSRFEHPAIAREIAWHPDGVRLAVPCDDWLVYLWDVETERRVALFAGHKAQVVTARFSHDGKHLATISWDKTLGLWDVERAQAILSYPVTGGTRFVEFSPDDTQLARFGDGISADVLELMRPVSVYQRTGIRSSPLHAADVNPDGQLLACTTGRGVHLQSFNSTSNTIFWPVPDAVSVTFLTHDRVVAAGEPGVLLTVVQRTFDPEQPLALDPPATLWPQPVAPGGDALSVAPHANRAIIRADADVAVILDLAEHTTPVARLIHPRIASVAISPTGRWAATAGLADGEVKVWDATTGALLGSWTDTGPARVLFEPGQGWLIVGGPAGCLVIESDTWNTLHRFPSPPIRRGGSAPALTVSPDGALLAIGWTADHVQLIHLPRGELLLHLEALGQIPLAFGPDGNALYVKGQYSEIYLWDLLTIRRELAAIGLDW